MPPLYAGVRGIPLVGLVRDTDKEDIVREVATMQRTATARMIRSQQMAAVYQEQMKLAEDNAEWILAHELATVYASTAMREEMEVKRIAELQEKVFRAFGM